MKRKVSAKPGKQLSARRKWSFRVATILLVLLFFEIASYISLHILDRRYPMDPLAKITPEKVNGFLSRHYDPDLGWAPRPTHGGDINSIGARSTHEYEKLENTISVYGDSSTFGVGVPVEDAWPTLLEEKLGRGVLNFGVGGYGTHPRSGS